MATANKKEEEKTEPVIKILEPKAAPTVSGANVYTLISLDASGHEKPGTEFNIGEKGYYQTYHSRTVLGGAKKPTYAVKKKN